MSRRAHARVRVVNRLGLHARAAAKLVRLAGRFESEILLRCGGRKADAKSIMGVMMLAASEGSDLELDAHGTDAEAALEQLQALIAERFGEEK